MNWLTLIGILTPYVLGIAAFIVQWGSIKQRLDSHENLDKERFGQLTEMMTEVRQDIKTILRNHG